MHSLIHFLNKNYMQIYSVGKYSLNVFCLPELTVLYTRNTEISNHALRRKKEKKNHIKMH